MEMPLREINNANEINNQSVPNAIPTVNQSKYIKSVQPVQPQQNGFNVRDRRRVPVTRIHAMYPLVQERILSRLPTNEIINLYLEEIVTLLHPARNALRIACMRVNSQHIKILLRWDADKFERFLSLLGGFVQKITIVGMDDRGLSYSIMKPSDIQNRISAITSKCPNIIELRFQYFRMPLFDTECISSFHFLTNIEMNYWSCDQCVRNARFKCKQFAKFFINNPQLAHVKLNFVKESLYCECEYSDTLQKMQKFIDRQILPRLMNIQSFVIYDEANKNAILIK